MTSGLRQHATPWVIAAIILLALAAVFVFLLLPIWNRAARESDVLEEALQRARTAASSSQSMRWLPDDADQVRKLEPFRRDEIAGQYRQALEELAYARFTSDGSGLSTYFQEAALDDAFQASVAGSRSRLVSWAHQLRLHFYSPDGATVSFTDTAWSAQTLEKDGKLEDVQFAKRTVDVVMQLDDGNWRIHHWRMTGLQELPTQPPANPKLEPELAAMRGVNYVGRTRPFNDFWIGYDPTEVASSFALAKELHLNTLRVFVPYPTPEAAYTNLPKLLEAAKLAKLRVIVTLLDNYTAYRFEDLPNIFAGLERLLPLLRDPSVFAIDVKNEAERDAPNAGWGQIRATLSFLAAWLRSETHKPITAGLSQPDPELSRALDFVTVHHYGSGAQLLTKLQEARAEKKPVLLEEFGFHTQLDEFPDPHTEGDQARYYAKILAVLEREHVGFLSWTLHDFPTGPMPGGRNVERHLGLVRDDGSFKPAARVLIGDPAPNGGLEWIGKISALKAFWPLLLIAAFAWIIWRLRRGERSLEIGGERSLEMEMDL
jgi:type II secretory pathway pseudopilin PulG